MNDWVGCLSGYADASTPNIDALANRGVLFTNAHCPSPLCNPSRTAILTGKRPSTTGVYDNSHWWRPNLPETISMPMHFKANGYACAGAGKVFHHTDGNNPPDQWDEYFDLVFDDPWDRKAYRRVEDWRYIRYANGDEELYHTSEDPEERDNLARIAAYRKMTRELAGFLPSFNAKPALPKSAFQYDNDSYTWRIEKG